MARMPPGSVVSFMLPNWHEAAVIYLAATLAGMVVNPVLPSLRDRELQFILSDADSRAIFIPADFAKHDYVAMLDRVTLSNDRDDPEERVLLLGMFVTSKFAEISSGKERSWSDAVPVAVHWNRRDGPAGAEPRRRPHDPLHVGHHRPTEGRSAHAQFDPCTDLADRHALEG